MHFKCKLTVMAAFIAGVATGVYSGLVDRELAENQYVHMKNYEQTISDLSTENVKLNEQIKKFSSTNGGRK